MTHLPDNAELNSDNEMNLLEAEISSLENELQKAESELNAFESQIRSQLQQQIRKIRELTALYKAQKLEKKNARLEQKKKGKNYKEPIGLKKVKNLYQEKENPDELQKLKRLYKEAIVHIHPDKFAREEQGKTERAHDLTVQLNALYKSGNLDELSLFHEHILSGNAMSHIPFQTQSIVDKDAMISFLKKKKESLIQTLEQTKSSPTYIVLSKNTSPQEFIDDLKIQFEERIQILLKRTRIGK